ncbi:MAG: ABC transporter permease [Turicibacter sp.]|nr:ABC transporter permease [Turicibacter sp.]
MLNMMIADTQRIFRGRMVYLCMGVLILLISMHVFGVGQAGAGDLYMMASGATMPFYLMNLANNVTLFVITIVALIVTDDFSKGYGSNGTVKNVIAFGYAKTTYFFAKVLMAVFFATLFYLVHLVGGTLLSTLANGFGGEFNLEFLRSVWQPASLQLLLIIATTVFLSGIGFIVRNTTYLTYVAGAWMFIPMILSQTFHGNPLVERLIQHDLSFQLVNITRLPEITQGDASRIFLIAAGYIIVGIAMGLTWFQRSEIK